MKLTDLLCRERYSLSFEVFPPKTDAVFESVSRAALACARLQPSFVSVTYGAGGGRSRYTLELAERIHAETGVPTLAHLTCVSSTRETVEAQIAALKRAGIENVMALRGDLTPEMEAQDRSLWPYRHAIELVRELRESGADFCIGGACYPEVHPESASQKNLFYSFLYKIREAGITVPVLPGIMPITGAAQVERAVRLSGSFMPQRFRTLVDRFGTSPEAMRQAGIAYATDQIIDLFANGIRNVHIYTMNKPEVAGAIRQNVSAILGMPL